MKVKRKHNENGDLIEMKEVDSSGFVFSRCKKVSKNNIIRETEDEKGDYKRVLRKYKEVPYISFFEVNGKPYINIVNKNGKKIKEEDFIEMKNGFPEFYSLPRSFVKNLVLKLND